MPITSKAYNYSAWRNKQEALIASLRLQPLVVVLRPDLREFEATISINLLFELIEELQFEGVRHIEVAWSPHPNWIEIMKELKGSFNGISLGAASITNTFALESLTTLDLDYAMTPTWNPTLQKQARALKQLLVPGVCSPKEAQQSISFGYKLIKLFPASTLGIKYLHTLKEAIGSLPFVIAAGGLTVEDLNPWLKEGYGAIALGRELIQNHQIDPKLQRWVKSKQEPFNLYI